MSRTAKIVAAAAALLLLLIGSGGAACKLAFDCGVHRLGIGSAADGGDVPPISGGGAELPDGWEERTVVNGLEFPTDFAFLPSGEVLVSEKSGVVRVADPQTGDVRTVLDIRSRVSTSDLRGLLTVAVDPQFSEQPDVYVVYTAGVAQEDGPTAAHLSRFTWLGDRLDPSSEERLLASRVEAFHSGSQIAFARDGTLFVSTGDGVKSVEAPKSLRAQDVDALPGKVLHVTREGKGVPGNPFWNGDPDAARSKVWAYGFRNPFRLTLMPGSETPVVADVGYLTQDEVSVVERGSNNGWPCYEGTARGPGDYPATAACRELYGKGPTAHNAPVVSFDHSDTASITGGTFLRGDAVGSAAPRVYVMADFSYGWLRYLERNGATLGKQPTNFAERLPGPVALHVGRDGALYYLSASTGELRRLERTQ